MEQGELSHYCDFGCLGKLQIIEHDTSITATGTFCNCPEIMTNEYSFSVHVLSNGE